jgi:hypothetical protein
MVKVPKYKISVNIDGTYVTFTLGGNYMFNQC